MSARRVAIIDMGSNTCRLVVYRVLADDAWFLEDEIREVVRLREGMEDNHLAKPAMQRGYAVLRLFRSFCESVSVDTVVATATSAVRDADNGDEFLERAREISGWHLRVLEEVEEARLGTLGVLGEVPMTAGYVLDVGGGSAQISRVENGRWVRGEALPLGALRLTEAHIDHDPPPSESLQLIRARVREEVQALSWLAPLGAGETLAGLGGSIRNLGYIEHARVNWPLKTLRGFVLGGDRVAATVARLCETPRARRARIPGLNPDRADILPAGALVLEEVMLHLGAEECHVSVNGLREGLLLDHAFGSEPPHGIALRRFSVHSLARRYRVRFDHAARVERLATRLFDELQPRHGLTGWHRELLEAASVLHDVGSVLGYHDHHHHSQSLVVLNGLPGFTARETALVALMTRYHRKGRPTPGVFRKVLKEGDAMALRWLSAMLRMAEYLERGRNGNVTDVEVADWGARGVQIAIRADGDASVEQWDTERRAVPLLESLLECRVRVLVG